VKSEGGAAFKAGGFKPCLDNPLKRAGLLQNGDNLSRLFEKTNMFYPLGLSAFKNIDGNDIFLRWGDLLMDGGSMYAKKTRVEISWRTCLKLNQHQRPFPRIVRGLIAPQIWSPPPLPGSEQTATFERKRHVDVAAEYIFSMAPRCW